MSGVNKVILVGNLGQNPTIRRTASGEPIATLSIATSDTWKDKTTGEKKERTEWHKIVIFNENIANIAEKYLKKSSKIYIEGALQTRKYEKDGIERYTTEVVLQRFRGELALLDRQESNRAPDATSQDDYGSTRTKDDPRTQIQSNDAFDDDVPF